MKFSSKSKAFFLNILLAFFSLVLCFIVLEMVLRLTVYRFKAYPKSPGANHTYLIETDEFKTEIRTNSLNMRDTEIMPKVPGETRILCLGDSFTFGLGVTIPESYPKVLERELQKQPGRWSVINGGTQHNVKYAYEFLKETGLTFKPDWVVAQIYIGNDFYDWSLELNKTERGAQILAGTAADSKQGVLASLKSWASGLHVYTIEFLWTRLLQFPFIDDWLYEKNLRYDNRGIFLKNYPELEKKLVELEIEGLDRLKELCDREGIRLFILLAPTKQQLFKRKYLDNQKYDYRKPNQIIADYGASRNVPVLDLLPLYEALPESKLRKFYFVKDRHWTVEGHRHCAESLARFLPVKTVIDGN